MFVMIKPVSGMCNLCCSYCFYRDEMQKRETAFYGRMQEDTVIGLIRKALAGGSVRKTMPKSSAGEEKTKPLTENEPVTFGFQGGEPLLAGLAFYERFVALVQEYNTEKRLVTYTIQTNGLLLTEEFAVFFKKHDFLVGISLDGSKKLHDRYRVEGSGQGTFLRVMDAVSLLERFQVSFNVLTVIHGKNALQMRRVYRFFTESGIRALQFIPCLDPLFEEPGSREYSLTPALYARAMMDLFDAWYEDYQAGNYSYIRQFENWAGMLKGCEPEACSMGGQCRLQNVVEADGAVYLCDFYVLEKYSIGNVRDEKFDFSEMSYVNLFLEEQAKKRHSMEKECASCEFYNLCRGGCGRDLVFRNGKWENYYCSAYKQIFSYIYERLQRCVGYTEPIMD